MNNQKQIKPVVNIVNPAFQSTKCRSYAGTTKLLTFGGKTSAWARLLNPPNSKVCLFLDMFALTNFSTTPYTGQVLVNAIVPGKVFTSPNVANLNLGSPKLPMAKIQFTQSVKGKPIDGVIAVVRRVPPNETFATGELSGKVIVPPGESFLIFLTSAELVKGTASFQWWEGQNIF